jgi:ABC-type phosphate/phosphonate transport system substrate-binding protein
MRAHTTTAIAATLLLGLTACSSTDTTTSASVPPHKIVKQDDSGNGRSIVVEAESTENLKAIFDEVTKNLTDEAGYFIEINCSSGGTDHADNRLANGKKAVGNTGAARTGLEEGQTEFEEVAGRECPAN